MRWGEAWREKRGGLGRGGEARGEKKKGAIWGKKSSLGIEARQPEEKQLEKQKQLISYDHYQTHSEKLKLKFSLFAFFLWDNCHSITNKWSLAEDSSNVCLSSAAEMHSVTWTQLASDTTVFDIVMHACKGQERARILQGVRCWVRDEWDWKTGRELWKSGLLRMQKEEVLRVQLFLFVTVWYPSPN